MSVLIRDCDDNGMHLEDIEFASFYTFCRFSYGTVPTVWYICFSLLSFIGIKVNVACVKVDKGCIQHAFCNSSSICQCSKGYNYKGGACKYLKSIYLYYFVGIKEKEIQFLISLICNTIFNAILSYIVVVGHNILCK